MSPVMKPSVKGGKVRQSHMETLSLDHPPDDAEIAIKEAFAELVRPSSPQQQIGAVEKLLEASMTSEKNAETITVILTSTLLQLSSKSQLRTKIFRFLPIVGSRYPDSYRSGVVKMISNALTSNDNPARTIQGISLLIEDDGAFLLPLSCKEKQRMKTSVERTEDVVLAEEFKQSVMEKFHPLILGAALQAAKQLFHKSFKECSSSVKVTLSTQQLQQLMKSATLYVQQYTVSNSEVTTMLLELEELLKTVLSVVREPRCPIDLRINCGQLVAVIQKTLSHGAIDQLVHQVVIGQNYYVGLPPLSQMALINGVLCVTPGEDLFMMSASTTAGMEILQEVLALARKSNDGGMAMSVMRVIHQWTLRTIEALRVRGDELNVILHPETPLICSLLDYIWLAWDHYLDSVKHAAKETFINFIKIQQMMNAKYSRQYFQQICSSLLSDLTSQNYRFSAVSCLVPAVGSQALLELYPDLSRLLLTLLMDPSLASHSADLLQTLFTQHQKEVPVNEWQDVWLGSFLDLFSKEMQTFGYELLFKKLLFTCPESLDVAVARLLEATGNPTAEKLCLLLMCGKIGRLSPQWLRGCQARQKDSEVSLWKSILPYNIIKLCLSHMDEAVQIAALSLLCESPKSTELLEEEELDLILDYYTFSVTNPGPSYQQHLLKSTKKLLSRIKEGTVAVLKIKSTSDTSAVVKRHSLFCNELFTMMVKNLGNGSSNARRSTSLLILDLLHQIILNDSAKIFELDSLNQDPIYIDTLISVLDDSYESNKIIAIKLLLGTPHAHEEAEHTVKSLVTSSFTLASSCRPPDSLTAAYLLKYLASSPAAVTFIADKLEHKRNSYCTREWICRFVMESLRKELKVAEKSLLQAAATGPMYGHLLCLRLLISDLTESELAEHCHTWAHLMQEILQVCHLVADLVAPVVRNSSPEGHLPMDLNPESLATLRATLQASLGNELFQGGDTLLSDELAADELVKAQAVSAQMLLLCAWRSVKEVSLILGDLVRKMPLPPQENAILSTENVMQIGRYFLTQLSETKHRGAFEQTYVGFSRICERLWQCEENQLQRLPEKWLRDVVDAIQSNDNAQLCSTRRSAGVPFIVQAVLSSEPSVRGAACLKDTMETLLKLASDLEYNGSEARIHAFNILRAVYRESRLGDHIIPYVSDGVKAAIHGYKSNSWGERNSAALLFAALITRMLGVKKTQDDLNPKNAVSALVFFKRYPELYDFLRDELESGALGVKEGKLVPALFPTLLLLARLAPAPVECRSSAISVASFTPAVLSCTSSSVLQMRALASSALVPLVTPNRYPSIVKLLCEDASVSKQNSLHGSLLCLLKLIKCYHDSLSSEEDKNTVITSIFTIPWVATESNPCLVTRSCALELFAFLLTKQILSGSDKVVSDIRDGATSLVSCNDRKLEDQPWSALCRKEAAHFLLVNSQYENTDISDLLDLLLNQGCYDVQLLTLLHILNLPVVPPSTIRQLMLKAQVNETHSDCLTYIYRILSKTINPQHIENIGIDAEKLTGLLYHSLKRLREESFLEILGALLQLTSAVVLTILAWHPGMNVKDPINEWIEIILNCSSSEHSVDTRLIAAQSLSQMLPFCTIPSISETVKLDMYEGIITQLQDDDKCIRDVAAHGAQALFSTIHQSSYALQPSRVLEKICGVIGDARTPAALSLLVKLILKEDSQQTFGLTQDDDRVFDKGEMNLYSEDLEVGRRAVKSLTQILTTWSSESSPTFVHNQIVPFLCKNSGVENCIDTQLTEEKHLNDPSEVLTLCKLQNLLEADIMYVADQLSALQEKATFCVRNVDFWLVRLRRLSILWRSLAHISPVQSEDIITVLGKLKKSVLKTKFISDIIKDLSIEIC